MIIAEKSFLFRESAYAAESLFWWCIMNKSMCQQSVFVFTAILRGTVLYSPLCSDWFCIVELSDFYIEILLRQKVYFRKVILLLQVHPFCAVACRGLVMPWATAWFDTPYTILVLSIGIRWSLSWRYAVCDVVIRRHIHVCKFVDTCIFRDGGAAVGQGGSKKIEGNRKL